MRLTSRLLMKSVKEERDQASASGLKGAAPGARRLAVLRDAVLVVDLKDPAHDVRIVAVRLYASLRHVRCAMVFWLEGGVRRSA
ncbi:hypothetical protein KJE20_05032 [Pyrenophora tritici-repentis]|uniref:Uncharacterized protein n=1 Tax=Pyrenophora tritici-repentis TaxID=45151 RepID=A0A922N436_9PLEO|nr:hypothetical protein Ptr86124_011513 [Pyrenophora tritici-repentis]KAI1684748.1 hypothetical protein KJE20_05032 [Pyrenophora tritici-repentis]